MGNYTDEAAELGITTSGFGDPGIVAAAPDAVKATPVPNAGGMALAPGAATVPAPTIATDIGTAADAKADTALAAEALADEVAADLVGSDIEGDDALVEDED